MKKLVCFLTVTFIALGAFALWSDNTRAQRKAFGKNDLERVKEISLEHLTNHLTSHGLGGGNENIEVKKVFVDDLEMGHTRVRQTVNDIPVWGGEAIIHIDKDGSLSTITDNLVRTISVNTEPNFPNEDAIKIAEGIYSGSPFLTEKPVADKWIYRAENGDHLVYRVQMRREDGSEKTAMPVMFIDAHTGEKVFEYDNLQTATGSGSSLYSGTVSIQTYQSGSTYYMEDIGRKIGTFDNRSTTGSTYRFSDSNNVWNSTTQRAGVDAHYGAAQTYDYYLNVHGRNGIDGSGGPGHYQSADGATTVISSKVHYGSNYNNAFWNGSFMTYGDGDGSTFSPLVTLDISAHEMTHGVTERTANLVYANESGALNESMSDVFGAMVERYSNNGTVNNQTWQIGEDAYTPGTSGDALRSMSNTHASGDPDHYNERYTGSGDNGGVHTNSGIPNYVFYLLSQGGTNHVSNVTVSGIGANAAEKIFYRALTVYMTSSTNFAGARTATLNAASNLYGSSSSQYNATQTAWCAVGVGSCPTTPTPTPTPTATPTPTPGGTEYVTNGGFENSLSPWTKSGSGALYTSNGSYSHSGSGYSYLGAGNNRTGYTYQLVSIPSNASTANLTFWLNATTNESGGTAYDFLEIRLYNSSGSFVTTLDSFDNTDAGTAGNYSQKGSYNLSAYKGQSVYVLFYARTDGSLPTTFRVDDVSVK